MHKSILFLTHAEHGQATIILAAAITIAQTSTYRVHIASYEELRERVDSIINTTTNNLVFHALPGKSLQRTVAETIPGGINAMVLAPDLLSAWKFMGMWSSVCLGAGPDEYLDDYEAIQGLVKDIDPAAVVVDALFLQAHDAVRGMGLRCVTMDPISAQMSVGFAARGLVEFLRYPMPGLGSRYPLSLVDWFRNILLARKAAGIIRTPPSLPVYRPQDLYLCPYIPATTFPGAMKLPQNVVGLPPVHMPANDLLEQDSELLQWLSKRPTVLINFGSSEALDDRSDIGAIVEGTEFLFESLPDVQVLWKTSYDWSTDRSLEAKVDRLVKQNRLRVSSWLTVDPSALLRTGHIVCSVHHGGANSFYEACSAGVPQLILPLWADTFVFAERARYLGFGLIGNAGTAPRVDATQFKSKLLRVMTDERIREKAAEIGNVCREMDEGREVAARAVIEWAERSRD